MDLPYILAYSVSAAYWTTAQNETENHGGFIMYYILSTVQ